MTRDIVHEALEVLFDSVSLADSRLVRCFPALAAIPTVEGRGKRARALILEAIEVLRPARREPLGSLGSRTYDVLSLRYAENRPADEVIQELCIGRRQYYRNLADAEERLSEVLRSWVARGATPDAGTPGAAGSALSDELTALASRAAPASLAPLMQEVLLLVRPLASRLGVLLDAGGLAIPHDESALVDGTMLKQVLVLMLSSAIQSLPPDGVRLRVRPESATTVIEVRFLPGTPGVDHAKLDQAQGLAASQRITCDVELGEGDCVRVSMRLRRGKPTSVLVVEDSAGAVDLYRRYLAGGSWRVEAVSNPRLAVDTAVRLKPDAIIVDIIMPDMDGWSVIKALREHEETAAIPVIACSVVDDPLLAASLGASECLTKPLGQAQLISALNACTVGRSTRRPAR